MGADDRRIAFIAFHDVAQAYHFGPVLFELAGLEGAQVDVYCDEPLEEKLREFAGRYPARDRLRYLRLERTLVARLRALLRGDRTTRVLPWAHLPRLAREYDAIVLPCNYLRRRVKQIARKTPLPDRAAFVFVPHGGRAGADPYAEGVDFALAFGVAMERGFKEIGMPCREVGYPKLDLPRRPGDRLFAEDRPTVMYNPHWRVARSWPLWGEKVLEFFAASREYNLIFAPHINLFGRHVDPAVLARFRGLPNIHVDVDGPRLLDLTYATVADAYMGDYSSQVFEVLALKRRPCLFLDPNRLNEGAVVDERVTRLGPLDWIELKAGWKCGEVVSRFEELPAALARAFANPGAYRAAQDAVVADQFVLTDVPSGRRAGEAILEVARLRRR